MMRLELDMLVVIDGGGWVWLMLSGGGCGWLVIIGAAVVLVVVLVNVLMVIY